jgi:hypothetical protein
MERIKDTVAEVLMAILPVSLVVYVLIIALNIPRQALIQFTGGLVFVVIGFVLFLLGAQIGLLPFGETVGAALPRTNRIGLVLLLGFLLGLVITVAEPDVRVLASQVDAVSGNAISQSLMIISVGLGVAIFVAVALIRIVYNIPIRYLLLGGYTLVLILAYFVPPHFLSVSFDAGGVTTGPITVPFILSLGVGVVNVLGTKRASSEGFGMVALASIGPVLAIMVLGVIFG